MKHIDKVFRDKLYNHETPVPEGIWEKIAPAIEDNSGRSIFWMWFVGILALILGSAIAYTVISSSPGESFDPLAKNIDNSSDQSSISEEEEYDLHVSSIPMEIDIDNDKEAIQPKAATAAKANKVSTVESASDLETVEGFQQVDEISALVASEDSEINGSKANELAASSNQIERQSESKAKDIVTGTPANLLITKSYINGAGSFVEQSNVTEEIDKPVYNVFINSEGLNAGALMRIIEPLQSIPLPAFKKPLKKKISTNL